MMGSEKRFQVKTSEIILNPGPGQYNPTKLNMHKSISISIPQSRRHSKNERTPGPATYNFDTLKIRSRTPSMAFN